MLCVSKCTRNVLTTANLSYKNTYISEKDKISVIKKNFFILQIFLCTVKKCSCTLVYTGAHREDHWFKLYINNLISYSNLTYKIKHF